MVNLVQQIAGHLEPVRGPQSRWRFPYLRPRRARNFQVLMYHRVNDQDDGFLPSLSVAEFEPQMEALARYFCVLPLQELAVRALEGDLPPNAVAITFDDGYRDNYLQAFPILQRYGLKATFFLATDVIGTGKIIWHDQVFHLFHQTRCTRLDWKGQCLLLRTAAERYHALGRVRRFLGRLKPLERDRDLVRLFRQCKVPLKACDAELMLTWDQVRNMQRAGMTFGAHTATHTILTVLDVSESRREIETSKRALEENLGVPVRAFAYPNGLAQDYAPESFALLRKAGFNLAVTAIFGNNDRTRNPFELRRCGSSARSADDFALRLSWHKFVL